MSSLTSLLKQKADETNTPLWIIEKDYALSYLLAGINEVPPLRDWLVLKGGTALGKAYFQNYRFSEDLDYSSRKSPDVDNVEKGITVAVDMMEAMLQEKGPVLVQSERLHLREPHPRGQIAYIIRIQFPHHREPICRLKIEITVDEQVLLPPQKRAVLHGYEETFNASMYTYPLAEIAAEKYRALLQSLKRIQEKGWGANRACRDYYDLWWIQNEVDLTEQEIPTLTTKKCNTRGVTYQGPNDFFNGVLVEVAQREWDQLLLPFVPQKVRPDKVLMELQAMTRGLWDKH